MRSLLFVPGDSERKLEKGFGAGADVVIVDLEDSVAPHNKALAREIAARFIAERRAQNRVRDLCAGQRSVDRHDG
ncbi:citrate lyase beta subunit [Mesorhizobium sangaii]|uniref:Citrate lyase beta subunit n=1 Tax=Mesorhizobium sangaii TaxID=505389 RepID=A0A841P6J2_9HYPH|nr:citrate lyase beta subunit [Mesorhizobium sangaii]